MDISCSVFNQDEKTVEDSLWQKNEHIHRRIIFMDKERNELQESITETENEMLSIFENSDFQVSETDFVRADNIVKGWIDHWFDVYKNQSIYYPSVSLYSRFWKRTNRFDGFFKNS